MIVLTRQKKTWFFDQSKSTGSLDDEIFTFNMIAYAAAEATRYPGFPFSVAVNSLSRGGMINGKVKILTHDPPNLILYIKTSHFA